mmetsp:Transcript_8516/g.16299  ORF Transcript_8516/g.16299 Transcript_8516/m.16299 type:complete len:256 (+) Transcript_8516:1123-1890(+)
MPAATATMFFKVPHISAPTGSAMSEIRKYGRSINRFRIRAWSGLVNPMTASDNSSLPMSAAMLAPINTAQSMLVWRETIWEMSCSPSRLTRMPLVRLRAKAPALSLPSNLRQMPCMNWCGTQSSTMSASRTASPRSGTASTLDPREILGRYFGFSCRSLISSVSFFVCLVGAGVGVGVVEGEDAEEVSEEEVAALAILPPSSAFVPSLSPFFSSPFFSSPPPLFSIPGYRIKDPSAAISTSSSYTHMRTFGSKMS